MSPRTTFPGSGPDQSVFMVLFALGFVIAVIGYLSGFKSLRLAGIMLVFAATAVLMADVLSGSTL